MLGTLGKGEQTDVGVITSTVSTRPYPIPPRTTATVSLGWGGVVPAVVPAVGVVKGEFVIVTSVVIEDVTEPVVVVFTVEIVVEGSSVVKSPSQRTIGGVNGPETQEEQDSVSPQLEKRKQSSVSQEKCEQSSEMRQASWQSDALTMPTIVSTLAVMSVQRVAVTEGQHASVMDGVTGPVTHRGDGHGSSWASHLARSMQ